MDKYDTILYIDPTIENINEDDRNMASSIPGATPSAKIGYGDYIDPELYSAFSFGQSLRQQLNNIGDGFSADVTDFKKWVVVDIHYHNVLTGRSASKTFLVVFKFKGDGLVFSTHNKWRTISGSSLAASYIRSASSALKNETNLKL